MKRSIFCVLAVLLVACAEPTVAPLVATTHLPSPGFNLTLPAVEAVMPSGYAAVMGETNNSIPFAWKNVRYQQVVAASDVIDPKIVKVCLRRDKFHFFRKGSACRKSATNN